MSTAAGPAYDRANDTPHRAKTILRALPAQPGRALDLGAGTGWLAKALAGRGWQVTAIEADKQAARRCEAPGVEVFNQTLTNPALEELTKHPYQLIAGLNILHHLADPRWALTTLHQAHQRGTTLLLQIPDRIEQSNPAVAGSSYLAILYDIAHSLDPAILGWAGTDLDWKARRPLLMWDRHLAAVGTVTAGNGHTTTQWPDAGQLVADNLGVELHPGTLNLELDRKWTHPLDILADTQWGPIMGRRVQAAGVEAWAAQMPNSDRGPRFLELMATSNLRDTIGLSDASRIPIRLETSS